MDCHACQSEIPIAGGDSLGFRDECDRCRADLHVCLNCIHHDLSAYNECKESNAERVFDRNRANRCDYFRPRTGSRDANVQKDNAMEALESLFKKD